ncbi:glycoside hydrolase family 15 protein [Agarilytica rhodophyticola]|uniref:glycoside hydrolase family 15 protein n=1 Tax=Agarilytica rhodophyticola TaxID=1737490 RepID=UPI001FEC43EC|nr:glycoside hydrolase family 15 protein [Agarilytica rhodophyticola]
MMAIKSIDLLDSIYKEVSVVILRRQHPVTGLLPASTSINTHGNYTDAWVRDNVYSIMCVWALGLAYRKHGEKIRSDELEQSTIKLMRGLLQSMMRQADKVEIFKHSLNPIDALHAKYDTATGLPVVADDAWGHLQIDATSLFLLMLGQISASGSRIIFTYDEVDFIQNLIYYIAGAYRTPDFGIWERGNKINNGKTEINASSLGMAKAALQALDGFNLFGKNASPRAIVHTVADSISLARATLASILPRESLSKEVDSALLSIIGFPAFAVGDEALVIKTRDKILATLGGNYGCKRFIWDGHQTVLEDSSRLYYEHTELANFENVESEWPLFYTFLYIDALFNENEATAKYYRDKIESLMVEVDGFGLIPELYYLPEENIAAEKKHPRSQQRVANENVPLVWAQSLYLTGLMIDEGLLTTQDLDSLRLRRRSTRFIQPEIALVVLAENDEVKELLSKNGVIAESLDDIRPINVISAPHLVEAYAQVGANASLGLTGRPKRRLQSLSTSKTYDINGTQFLCLSWIQGDEDDYLNYDARCMAYKIEQEISHIRKHWLNTEVAVFTFMVEQRTCKLADIDRLFQTLRSFQLKANNERVGYASAKLAYRASSNSKFIVDNLCITPIYPNGIDSDKSLIDHLPDAPNADTKCFVDEYQHILKTNSDAFEVDSRIYVLIKQFTDSRQLHDETDIDSRQYLLEVFDQIYYIACRNNHWRSARFCFTLLNKVHSGLSEGLSLLGSRHLSVVLGSSETQYKELHLSSSNEDVIQSIKDIAQSCLERSLIQELLAIIGSLVRTNPDLFDGLRSIYVHNLLALCAKNKQVSDYYQGIETLASLSPVKFLDCLTDILQRQKKTFTQGIKLNLSQNHSNKDFLDSAAEQAHAIDTDWLQWRSARGLIQRFDETFLKQIWQSLAHTKYIIFGDLKSEECALDTEAIRRSMTPGEESFAHLIDSYTQQLHPPYYKSAVVETLYAYTQYCQKNTEVYFNDCLDLGAILESAADAFVKDCRKNDMSVRSLDIAIELSPFQLQEYLMKVLPDFISGTKEESEQ